MEAGPEGTNRRAIVTNRSGAAICPEGAYDDYVIRGESALFLFITRRNKELKCGLEADRRSDHRYMENLFRLNLHCLAHNLLVRARQLIAEPPAEKVIDGVPPNAQPENSRRQQQNRRRREDPLGEGQPCTWRTRLIKVAAEIRVSSRRILIILPRHWPYLHHFEKFCDKTFQLGLAGCPPS
ncbi:hypothetical protein Pan161_52830 [Gimesia algae]|uniref:Transposase DDE domain-containing protein n=1 Tax=Gimesia algae TaxID=2527971 RepID=A0A517VKQ9_9PLAN|nr:hypothetical protein Pan161_52830 [Gimesia algae]